MEKKELSSTFTEYEKWLAVNKDMAQEYIERNDVDFKNLQKQVERLLTDKTAKAKIIEFVKMKNEAIDDFNLSVRSYNALKRGNISYLYEAIPYYPDEFASFRNLGVKSVTEICGIIEKYVLYYYDQIIAYMGGKSAMYSDEYVQDTVMSCFEYAKFKGISFKEICDEFPDEFDENRIKKCIESLLADKKLEYVDFKLYRVYPSVYTVIDETYLDEESKAIMLMKFSGMTLETIGQEFNLTRERIRQKFEKQLKKLRMQLLTEYGCYYFDEDYYAYLYTNYEVVKEMWLDYLGVSEKTLNYLSNTKSKGKTIISDALSDPKIDLNLKFKIQDYLNRNKILIDGRMIERERSALEEYALSKLARDEISYEEFAIQYNALLHQNGIEFDEKLYYTDEIRRTRRNRLADSTLCLWKQGEKIRYYDIADRDYEELLDAINLESFADTEVSTLKLLNDYREVMAKYDIRDQYELHNLLKKVVDCSEYNDMSFGRQPIIKFGTFNRTKAIYDIIEALSPITFEDLVEYLLSEYGYDKATSQATYLQPLNYLYHQGVYSVEFKQIPYDRIEILDASLTEEFYYISEIKTLYKNLFEDADPEEINQRSLKLLGYNVFASYVLKTYSKADSYFRDLINSNDVFSAKDFNKRYGTLQSYLTVFYDMRRNYDILAFERGQYINFRKIEKLGISKEDIRKYCDDVYNQIDENQYFTVYTLRELEISTKLDFLGFDEIFLGEILATSSMFLHTKVFGQVVLYKGKNIPDISKKTFILSQLSNYDAVDIDQFKEDCFDIYGVRIPEKYEIINAIADTDYYYDEIMDKVYRNKDIYYSEFDD